MDTRIATFYENLCSSYVVILPGRTTRSTVASSMNPSTGIGVFTSLLLQSFSIANGICPFELPQTLFPRFSFKGIVP